jgi:hypothetical protein
MRTFIKTLCIATLLFCSGVRLTAQTDMDGLMMAKRNLCGGIVVGQSQWNHYWEGTLYRNNENIGTLTSQMAMAMANYGVSDKFNIIASAPYIKNQTSAGTLRGQQGIQDGSFTAKWEFFGKGYKYAYVSLLALGSVSAPLTNYVADYLPLAIGMHSRTASGKLMVDIQHNRWFATASTQYTQRANVTIDREAYYTTEMIYSHLVAMPSVLSSNVRFGYRKNAELIIEAVYDRMNTLGGFDIRRNDMPFLSNNMEASRIGLNWKLPVPKMNGLSWLGNATTTIMGRNMGQSHMVMTGLVYQGEFKSKNTPKS